jgi:predicted amidohydrolase YtcJ
MRERAADVVFTSGHVHTVDARQPRAEAVAIHSERISAVGRAAAITRAIGPATRVIDLTDRMLVPGFQDDHVHPLSGGMDRMQSDLREARGRPAVLERIRAYLEAHPGGDWVLGSGWSMSDFPGGTPRREDLDAILLDAICSRPTLGTSATPGSSRRSSAAKQSSRIRLSAIEPDQPPATLGDAPDRLRRMT